MSKLLTPNLHKRILNYSLGIALLLLISSIGNLVLGQCAAQSCLPGGPTNSQAQLFQMGIRNVTLSDINKTSSFISASTPNSYHDYTCTDTTTLTSGTNYVISVETNGDTTGTTNENVRVWLDMNNDSVFSTSELILSSNSKKIHTGTINISGSSVLNTNLRMRVASEWVNAASPIPTPCGDRTYSEVEDYSVKIELNTAAPDADFSASPRISCDGAVQFTDQSVNGPTSWKWLFGDGTTDTVQNPLKTYSINDTFDVTLIVSNINGIDTVVKNDFIIKTGFAPVAANCTPITNAYCCGYGIRQVQIDTFINASSDASVGYEDFTCDKFVTLIEGINYNISLLTNPSTPEAVKVYFDLNGNGSFFDPNELIYANNSVNNPSFNFTMPISSVPAGTPLRMRFITDAVNTTFDACTNLTRGQAEDYTVIAVPNPFPPVAAFNDDYVNACQDSINFTDQSSNFPSSWFWDFGDGSTDTIQNPTHVYAANGTYTVKLITQNNNGIDSIEQTYTIFDGADPASCVAFLLVPNSTTPLGIRNVTFGSINNNTFNGQGFPAYEDFACSFSTTITQGQSYPISISTMSPLANTWVSAWIDFNDDGVFHTSERIFESIGDTIHNGNAYIQNYNGTVFNKPLRLRVVSDWVNSSKGPQVCDTIVLGQTEDYSVVITAPQTVPVADFIPPLNQVCNATVSFKDNTSFVPTSWLWTFGDGDTSSLINPFHTYSQTGPYNIKLVVSIICVSL